MKNVAIRNLEEKDIDKLVQTHKSLRNSLELTLQTWKKWFKEQQEGIRTVCILEGQNEFLGYGSLLRCSAYPFFRENNIPEIHAVWIHESVRRQGLGEKLIQYLELMAYGEGYKSVGLSVGLYNTSAQKLYCKMNYQLDGNGATYSGAWATTEESPFSKNEVLIWLIKSFFL